MNFNGLPILHVSVSKGLFFLSLVFIFLKFIYLSIFPFLNCFCFAGIEVPKYVDTVTPQYKPKFEALVRTNTRSMDIHPPSPSIAL
jgi:hypothetical protein